MNAGVTDFNVLDIKVESLTAGGLWLRLSCFLGRLLFGSIGASLSGGALLPHYPGPVAFALLVNFQVGIQAIQQEGVYLRRHGNQRPEINLGNQLLQRDKPFAVQVGLNLIQLQAQGDERPANVALQHQVQIGLLLNSRFNLGFVIVGVDHRNRNGDGGHCQ